ncbi:MAG: maleylpyruvate isomerase N-terminal domain-containing protein [Chloroflexi bacterium]|nr:maleylpyruvate isomerase N-terminal domain-containing protein [Chloroflexota bacterium]
MYGSAMEFLEEERDAWRPFEALAGVPDERMDVPVPDAHGWSARDLAGHLVAWQTFALATARELAIGERSATKERLDAEWAAGGDALNESIEAEWRALPLEEVLRRLDEVPGELRGTLTMVPETRWIKHPDHLQYFIDETIDHYAEHGPELAAILAAAGR